MLDDYSPEGAIPIVGNLFTYEFSPHQFDTIVFPLILHHTAEGSWRNSERRIEEAMERASPWLKPKGTVYIIEYCPHTMWYPIQRALFPFTKVFLNFFNQPPVVNYTRNFYLKVLNQKFFQCSAVKIIPEVYDKWAWFPLFMATPWLKLPWAIYPKMHIFSGEIS